MVSKPTPYNHEFYEFIAPGSESSARAIVPLVLDIVQATSVVDVGCGACTWLKVFSENGIPEILGIDGDYIPREFRSVPESSFLSKDLTEPLDFEREFDLAVSLEVAEHLPPNRAASFVKDLTNLAPVILFSAAIPHQGGTHHVNEQWPEYWRDLFAEYDYLPFDVIRPQIWSDKSIEWWYRQNIFLYASKRYAIQNPKLAPLLDAPPTSMMSVVHPEKFLRTLPSEPYLTGTLSLLPGLFARAIKRRLSIR